jgi:hypothetical protein
VRLAIPLHPELKAALADLPKDNLTFLVTQAGKPILSGGLHAMVRGEAKAAGPPANAPPHGLRKASARRWPKRAAPPIKSLRSPAIRALMRSSTTPARQINRDSPRIGHEDARRRDKREQEVSNPERSDCQTGLQLLLNEFKPLEKGW